MTTTISLRLKILSLREEGFFCALVGFFWLLIVSAALLLPFGRPGFRLILGSRMGLEAFLELATFGLCRFWRGVENLYWISAGSVCLLKVSLRCLASFS